MYKIFEELLLRNKVTAYKVGKETGISTATLTQWKNGKSTPKQDKLKLIADYLNVSIDFLTGDSKRTFCHDCGVTYNPLNKEEDSEHLLVHAKWEKAVEKYGFCWNQIRSDEKELLHRKLLADKSLSPENEVYHIEEVLKATFSDLLRENNFEYKYDFNAYVSKQLWKHSIQNMISRSALEQLKEKYGIVYENDPTLNPDEITNEKDETRYYLNDETAKIAQEVFENKDLKLLFDASRNAKPEDIKFVAEMLQRLKAKENFEE